jgi:hypothetical protein
MSLLPALAALAVTVAPVSQSKLGVIVLGDDATSQAILAACPRLAVFPIDAATAARAAIQIASYKAACTGATVIVQVGGKGLAVDGTTATTNWNAFWLPQIQVGNTALVDGVEGPSEPQGTAPNLAAFWASFAQLVSAPGFLPVVGALPPVLPVGAGSVADEFCTTVSQVRLVGVPFAWSYHARSPTMTTTLATESSTTFAYRQIAADCALTTTTLFLTEAGPSARNWQATDGTWLSFFDFQLFADAEVPGAALFEAGGTDTPLTPAVTAVTNELANPLTDAGVPDGGADAGNPGGVFQGSTPVGGSLVPVKTSGCSTGGPTFLMLALSPVLFVIRRPRK